MLNITDRPGEADRTVAEHRNGATRGIMVAFQGHNSRFVDMAHGASRMCRDAANFDNSYELLSK